MSSSQTISTPGPVGQMVQVVVTLPGPDCNIVSMIGTPGARSIHVMAPHGSTVAISTVEEKKEVEKEKEAEQVEVCWAVPGSLNGVLHSDRACHYLKKYSDEELVKVARSAAPWRKLCEGAACVAAGGHGAGGG